MLLVFWIVFFSACNITDRFYRGWAGGRGGDRRGRVGSRRRVKATTQTQRAVVCLQFVAQTGIGKKPSVKADLANYDQVLGVSG